MRPTAQQSDAATHVTAESDVGAKPPSGEVMIDQRPAAVEDSGMLEKPAVGRLLKESTCWLTENGAPRGSRGLPAMLGGSGIRGGRALAPGVNSVASWSGRNKAGGTVALEKMEVPGVGLLAYRKDPEGNIFGVLQPFKQN